MILPILETPTHPSNYGSLRPSWPEFIIIHGSGLPLGADGLQELTYLRRPYLGVSYHLYVARNGTVARLVPETHIAHHAGESDWSEVAAAARGVAFPPNDAGRSWRLLNRYSIGVGLESHNQTGEVYPEIQLEAAAALVGSLMGEYSIPYHRILTHAMVSAPRKVDPLGFDLAAFLERIPA